jgi:hypothetical protein
MQKALFALVFAGLCNSAAAGEISSAYSDLDTEKDCTVFAAAEDGEGDWANLVCNGYRGYPVFIHGDDLRESTQYCFPPGNLAKTAWESFSGFNSVGAKVEWRLETIAGRSVPFAAIHRRSVTTGEDASRQVEVLVVSKVAQIDAHEGCVIGLVLATGTPKANEAARRIADEKARGFACGKDERVVVGSPMPDFQRSEY